MVRIIETILIPHERIGIIKDKKTKETIEKNLKVKLSFSENLVEIEGEGLELYRAKDIVKAIGRGFSPEKAFRLFNEEENLEIIDLGNLNDKKIKIIKSRLIGTHGKTRRFIEVFSCCSVSIYGKSVALIGKYEQLKIAEEAVNMIIRGSKHSKVYTFLQDAKFEEDEQI